jgi:hypothetical protein
MARQSRSSFQPSDQAIQARRPIWEQLLGHDLEPKQAFTAVADYYAHH